MILLSTVRATPNSIEEQSSIGFLNDVRRLNVAITRSKFVLIVLGTKKVFEIFIRII